MSTDGDADRAPSRRPPWWEGWSDRWWVLGCYVLIGLFALVNTDRPWWYRAVGAALVLAFGARLVYRLAERVRERNRERDEDRYAGDQDGLGRW